MVKQTWSCLDCDQYERKMASASSWNKEAQIERHANLSSVMEEMPQANERLNKRFLGGNPRMSIYISVFSIQYFHFNKVLKTLGITEAGNSQLKTAFSQENSQNDERWNKLQERELQQKSGSETQEPFAKMTKKREKAIREELLQSGESSCKITSEEQFLPQEQSAKKRDMHEYKFGEKSLHSMILHRLLLEDKQQFKFGVVMTGISMEKIRIKSSSLGRIIVEFVVETDPSIKPIKPCTNFWSWRSKSEFCRICNRTGFVIFGLVTSSGDPFKVQGLMLNLCRKSCYGFGVHTLRIWHFGEFRRYYWSSSSVNYRTRGLNCHTRHSEGLHAATSGCAERLVDRLSRAGTRMALTVGAELGLSDQKSLFSSLLYLSV
ncbi:hypothetical protein QL285_045634 [Trifolium repens]|nr:hypothetical protein QL285_045634 [Trifolium repens]